MGRSRSRVPLDVFLNGRLVGKLVRRGSGEIRFGYEQEWLDWEHTFPISCSLPLREARYIGDPALAFFDNLLPDPEPVRRRIAERVGANGSDPFHLLAEVGRDCVGALQFLPEGERPDSPGKISARPVGDREVARIVRNLAQAPLGLERDGDFRISIAGAQEKTALLHWKGQWHVPYGTTPTTHILKPQLGVLPNGIDMTRSVQNEHLCLELAGALGLPVARTEIVRFDGDPVLVVERFDRTWGSDGRLLRLHQEDCCQALSVPSARKYDSEGGPGMVEILELLEGSDEPAGDRRTFLKAQIVFWLLGATDGHAKNFTLSLGPGGRFRLAPLYDVLSAQPAVDSRQLRKNDFRLALAVGGKRHYVMDTIQPRHFVQTADRVRIASRVIEEICDRIVQDADRGIEATLRSLPEDFPPDIAESITGGLRTRLGRIERFVEQSVGS